MNSSPALSLLAIIQFWRWWGKICISLSAFCKKKKICTYIYVFKMSLLFISVSAVSKQD